jgi:hypothetical protein
MVSPPAAAVPTPPPLPAARANTTGLAGHARRVDEHGYVVERPAGVRIGRPASRPPEPLLAELSGLVASCGATSAYCSG